MLTDAAMWSADFRSTSLSQLHIANSFIHIFFFKPSRQRRIGGVATMSRSTKNR